MAEHAAPEYATAPGNDYATHESTYEGFLHFVTVGTLHVVCVVIALAIGGTTGRWFVAGGLILFATFGAAPLAILTKRPTAMYVMLAVSLIALALAAA